VVVAQTNAMASLAARRTSHMLKAVVRRPSSNERRSTRLPKRSPRLAPLPGLPGR